MSDPIGFTLNGKQTTVLVEGWERMIDVLRIQLHLTGTKRGCDDGSCGACVVLMNGKAQRSCIVPAAKMQAADIVTIEGMSQGGELHPIQRAIVATGAIHCGFCTPGVVMTLHGLFMEHPDASDDEITQALAKNLCRCTGYEPILEGARLARQYLKEKRPGGGKAVAAGVGGGKKKGEKRA